MLAQPPAAEPRLRRRRHAQLLAAAIVAVALARFSRTQAPIALAFACYGALHAAVVGLALHPLPRHIRTIAFVSAAALLSSGLARLGLWAAAVLTGHGVKTAALLVVAASAFLGALGYGALWRWLLRYRLATAPLVLIALACLCAVSLALVLARRFPPGGSAWVAVLWWLTFSGGACLADERRARAAQADAATRGMP